MLVLVKKEGKKKKEPKCEKEDLDGDFSPSAKRQRVETILKGRKPISVNV